MCLEFDFTYAVQIWLESVHKWKIMSSKGVATLKGVGAGEWWGIFTSFEEAHSSQWLQ